jgi:hypothetical protein
MLTRALALAFAAIVFGLSAGFAQTGSQLAGEELLRALLAELRTLRTTLQRNAGLELRGQLLVERFRAQQTLVREMQREIDQRELHTMRTDVEEPYLEALEDVEARIQNATDPAQKKQMERERDMMKRRREMEQRAREEMRVRFQRQEQRLAEEREKLEAIEKEIAAVEGQMGNAQ